MNRIRVLREVGQPGRDLACVIIFIVAVVYYFHNLTDYLSAVQKPMLLEIGFAGSLVIALLYDLNRNSVRFSLVHATRTAILFGLGVSVAHYLRDQYLNLRAELTNIHELREFMSEDVFSALMNPVVGYGGCFAVGMVFMRLALGRSIERGLTTAFVMPKFMPSICPHCDQQVHH